MVDGIVLLFQIGRKKRIRIRIRIIVDRAVERANLFLNLAEPDSERVSERARATCQVRVGSRLGGHQEREVSQ